MRILSRLQLASCFALAVAAPGIAQEQKIGAVMPDGSVYAGVSPYTSKALYATTADAPGVYDWNHARAYCESLDASGHKDWRLPTGYEEGYDAGANLGEKDELAVLFRNRAAIGGFQSGAYPAGRYWSATRAGGAQSDLAWLMDFNGDPDFNNEGVAFRNYTGRSFSVRCVRSEP